MLLKNIKPELQKVYINNNNIIGAFYWKEDNDKYSVYIGDNVNLSGWVEYSGLDKKEAVIKTKELQKLIDSIIES